MQKSSEFHSKTASAVSSTNKSELFQKQSKISDGVLNHPQKEVSFQNVPGDPNTCSENPYNLTHLQQKYIENLDALLFLFEEKRLQKHMKVVTAEHMKAACGTQMSGQNAQTISAALMLKYNFYTTLSSLSSTLNLSLNRQIAWKLSSLCYKISASRTEIEGVKEAAQEAEEWFQRYKDITKQISKDANLQHSKYLQHRQFLSKTKFEAQRQRLSQLKFRVGEMEKQGSRGFIPLLQGHDTFQNNQTADQRNSDCFSPQNQNTNYFSQVTLSKQVLDHSKLTERKKQNYQSTFNDKSKTFQRTHGPLLKNQLSQSTSDLMAQQQLRYMNNGISLQNNLMKPQKQFKQMHSKLQSPKNYVKFNQQSQKLIQYNNLKSQKESIQKIVRRNNTALIDSLQPANQTPNSQRKPKIRTQGLSQDMKIRPFSPDDGHFLKREPSAGPENKKSYQGRDAQKQMKSDPEADQYCSDIDQPYYLAASDEINRVTEQFNKPTQQNQRRQISISPSENASQWMQPTSLADQLNFVNSNSDSHSWMRTMSGSRPQLQSNIIGPLSVISEEKPNLQATTFGARSSLGGPVTFSPDIMQHEMQQNEEFPNYENTIVKELNYPTQHVSPLHSSPNSRSISSPLSQQVMKPTIQHDSSPDNTQSSKIIDSIPNEMPERDDQQPKMQKTTAATTTPRAVKITTKRQTLKKQIEHRASYQSSAITDRNHQNTLGCSTKSTSLSDQSKYQFQFPFQKQNKTSFEAKTVQKTSNQGSFLPQKHTQKRKQGLKSPLQDSQQPEKQPINQNVKRITLKITRVSDINDQKTQITCENQEKNIDDRGYDGAKNDTKKASVAIFSDQKQNNQKNQGRNQDNPAECQVLTLNNSQKDLTPIQQYNQKNYLVEQPSIVQFDISQQVKKDCYPQIQGQNSQNKQEQRKENEPNAPNTDHRQLLKQNNQNVEQTPKSIKSIFKYFVDNDSKKRCVSGGSKGNISPLVQPKPTLDRQSPHTAYFSAKNVKKIADMGDKKDTVGIVKFPEIVAESEKKQSNFASKNLTPEIKMRLNNDINDFSSEKSQLPEGGKDRDEFAITYRDFDILRKLGKGSFGEVYLVRFLRTGELFAMKALSKERKDDVHWMRYVMSERSVLVGCPSPYIAQLHFAFQTQSNLFLIMDFCTGYDLDKVLSIEKFFKEERAKLYTAELVLAITSLHQHDIIYRDLKPDNVMIDEQGHVKLIDFGMVKEGIMNSEDGAKTFCGSLKYLAPEMISKQGHGKSLDWYLVGVLFYEMIVGVSPYYTSKKQDLFNNILYGKLKLPRTISANARDFIMKILNRSSRKRLGALIYDEDGGQLTESEQQILNALPELNLKKTGALQVMAHPIFEEIKWRDLYLRDFRFLSEAMVPPKAKYDVDYYQERYKDSRYDQEDKDRIWEQVKYSKIKHNEKGDQEDKQPTLQTIEDWNYISEQQKQKLDEIKIREIEKLKEQNELNNFENNKENDKNDLKQAIKVNVILKSPKIAPTIQSQVSIESCSQGDFNNFDSAHKNLSTSSRIQRQRRVNYSSDNNRSNSQDDSRYSSHPRHFGYKSGKRGLQNNATSKNDLGETKKANKNKQYGSISRYGDCKFRNKSAQNRGRGDSVGSNKRSAGTLSHQNSANKVSIQSYDSQSIKRALRAHNRNLDVTFSKKSHYSSQLGSHQKYYRRNRIESSQGSQSSNNSGKQSKNSQKTNQKAQKRTKRPPETSKYSSQQQHQQNQYKGNQIIIKLQNNCHGQFDVPNNQKKKQTTLKNNLATKSRQNINKKMSSIMHVQKANQSSEIHQSTTSSHQQQHHSTQQHVRKALNTKLKRKDTTHQRATSTLSQTSKASQISLDSRVRPTSGEGTNDTIKQVGSRNVRRVRQGKGHVTRKGQVDSAGRQGNGRSGQADHV